MKKIGERITFEDQKGFTTIVIAPASVDWKNAMLFGWVIAWTYVGVYIAYNFIAGLFSDDQQIYFAAFMVFWFYFEFRSIKSLLWIKYGKELIKIDEEYLVFKKSIKSYGKANKFFLENIKKFEEIENNDSKWIKAFENSYWELGKETMQFEVMGKKVKFGRKLNEQDVKLLFKVIEKRLNQKLKRKK
ncbi:MAG: hypothetical protein KDC84_12290 [Crocinitomicaceae bacterium]|nr:hypothetical protein [Crocinitomicaceae bacterium]